jgi:Protein of unknown function (DUF3306)
MSGEESFLQRWSRRKQAHQSPLREGSASEAREEDVGSAEENRVAAEPLSAPTQSAVPPPTPVPPIETIGQGTDISPFLAAGVPEEITRAALRRAWSTDPAIRDFVGLSENFWDAPVAGGGIPGFGTLTIDEARNLLARLTGPSEEPDQKQQDPPATPEVSHPEGEAVES